MVRTRTISFYRSLMASLHRKLIFRWIRGVCIEHMLPRFFVPSIGLCSVILRIRYLSFKYNVVYN